MSTLWLSHLALNSVINEAKGSAPDETGGILLGYWATGRQDAVVFHATGPGPNAMHSPYSFYPDGDYHWKEIEAIYRSTNGVHTYLGDWHTHPSGGAFLSPRDHKTLRHIASQPASQTRRPIMMIVAGGESWVPFAWELDQQIWQRLRPFNKAISMNIKLFRDESLLGSGQY